ncbi:ankyrin repeat domain-containing protein, partial [Wolbachia endosymbiont of Pentalonia nigronervosa]|uniref:ankyrin repeat domain-containing protein n=1 Tax=Wolbachia endosymbiont of Pentalonia nigronervosa TaxID=1301914 RepID=UPI00165F1A15|nr:ankyrin repeat domain-containing protein [Wolbachia endosymbiont of Pentalonia nigronervosa]
MHSFHYPLSFRVNSPLSFPIAYLLSRITSLASLKNCYYNSFLFECLHYLENIQELLKKKVNINFQEDSKKNTPLHIAVHRKELKVIEFLVKNGAKADIKNSKGRTSLDIANRLKRQDIVEILKLHTQPNLQASVGDNQQTGSSVQQRSSLLEQVIRPKTLIHKVQKSDKIDDQDIKRPGKQGLHGEIYQLKLLMLFLKRGVDNQYSFRLSTEKKEAKKFDDLFFEITKDGKKEYRLLQAKHKDDESKKITFDNLLTESDSDYSLVKYFFSYQDSKKEKLFKNVMIKDVTVCTNINLDLDDKYELNGVSRTIREVVQEIKEKDNILDVDSETFAKEAVRYRFSDNVVSLLKPKLEGYNLTRLARRLAECFLKNNSIQHHQEHDIFNLYHTVLAKEVIDVKAKKFHDKFIKNEDISEDTQKFREAFAEEIKKQSKEVLTLEDINLAISDKRKVVDNKSVGLKLSKNFGNGEDKNWPNNVISDEDVKDFLDYLVFAVNQPNEEQLGEIIENDISKEFNFAAKDYVYNDLFVKMLSWLNGKGKEFISYQDGESFFDEIKQKLSELELTGLTLNYKSKVEKFGIKFNSDAVQEIGLDEFLSAKDSNKQVFNAISQQNTLSTIKVYQVLQNIYRQNYIFMRLNSILHLQDRVIQAFGSSNLLVIECKTKEKEEDIRILYDKLFSIIQSSSNKKVVLITRGNDLLANKFKSALRDKYQEKVDKKNSLIDLTIESQTKLLEEGKVIFQGKEVRLGTIINDEESKHLIDGEVLTQVINKEIEIGKALIDSKYNDIKDYYIDRTFNRHVKIKKGIKKEKSFLVTSDNQVSKVDPNQDIVLISDTGESFKELCYEYKKHSIHWLKNWGNDLIWQQSYGVLSKLRNFVDESQLSIQEYKPEKITDIKDRVVIISAEPGMGKSTVLTSLALKTKESNPSLWVIRINLLDCSNELEKETEKKKQLNEKEARKFLYRMVGSQLFHKEERETQEKSEQRIEKVVSAIVEKRKISLEGKGEEIKSMNLLEMELFNNFYNQGRVALLFDGFDEISPDYTEKVIELLQVLKNSKVEKLWITTRPYNFVQEKLEDQLSVFSYLLKPLLPEEQKGFLRKFWKAKLKLSELDEQHSGVFIDELLDSFPGSIGDKDFMSIPLHAFMVAEVFKDGFKSFYDSNKKELSDEYKRKKQDLVTLYEKFIDIKFDEGLRKDYSDFDTTRKKIRLKKKFKQEKEELIADHMKLALYEIFNKNEVEKLLSREEMGKVSELIDKITQGNEKAGLIERVIDSKPRFIHRTFAEYFASKLIYERLDYSKKSKQEIWEFFLDHILIDDRYNVIRRFIDCQLTDSKLFKLKIGNTVEKLLKERIDESKITQLHVAAKEGLLETIKFLLNSLPNGNYINAKDEDNLGSTPLHYAAQNGHLDVVKALLGKGADVNAKAKGDWMPLHSAAQNGHLNVVNALLGKGADVKAKTKDGWTSLHYATQNGHLNVVNALLGKGADVNAKAKGDWIPLHSADDWTPLHYADDWTPLHSAARKGHLNVVNALLGKGADVKAKTKDGWTPLHLAAINGHLNVVKALLGKGADVNAKAKGDWMPLHSADDWTPLHLAAINGHLNVVNALLGKGADVKAKTKDGWTSLHLAAQDGHLDVVEALWDKGADVNAKAKGDWTSLHLAAQDGHLDVVKALLGKGADVNAKAKAKGDWTSLHLAAQDGHLYVVEALLDKGADVNAEAKGDWTSLHLAAQDGHLDVVEALLGKGADVNAKAKGDCMSLHYADDWTPLHLAAQDGHLDVVKALLGKGADVKAKIKDGWTSLHLAAQDGHLDVVKALLGKGADVNKAAFYNGWTPLHAAAQNGHKEIVEILLKEGAHYNVKDSKGGSPLDLAKSSSSIKVLLDCIDNLFQAVKSGEEDEVRSLLQGKDSDTLKAILNARNTDNKTPQEVASINSDIEKLLREKLRVVQSPNQQKEAAHQEGEISAKECLPSTSHRKK